MTRLLIRDLAMKKGLNITTLGRKSALAYTTVFALWHDSPKVLNRQSLDRIAAALDVRVADLFTGEPTPEDGS